MNTTYSIRAAAVAFAVCIAALPVSAQSLKESLDMARRTDGTYLAAQATEKAALFRVEQAEAGLRPNVSLAANASATRSTPPGSDQALKSRNYGSALNGRYPIYGRINDKTVEQTQRSLELAQVETQLAEQDLIMRVAQAYFNVLTAREVLVAAQANLRAITEQLASAKRAFELGTAAVTDARDAQARHDLALAQEISARNELRVSRIALNQLVGGTGVEPRALDLHVTLPHSLDSDTPNAWVIRSETGSTVKRATLQLAVAQAETQKAEAADGATVDITGSFGGNSAHGSAVLAAGSREGFTRSSSIGLQLNLPLYSGGRSESRVKEALALEERARVLAQDTRSKVAQETRQAWYTVQSGQAMISALEAAEASSKVALEASQAGYKAGVRVSLDVLNSQTQLFNAQRDLAKARHDVILASVKLRQASGTLGNDDVVEIDQLLK